MARLEKNLDVEDATELLDGKTGMVFYVDLDDEEVYEITQGDWEFSRAKQIEYMEKAADVFAIVKE